MIRSLAARPAIAVMGVLLLLVGGLASFGRMGVDLFPDLDYPLVNIVTHYPAGDSEDMEILVTRPIENAVQDLQGLQRVRSVSAPGISRVTAEFVWGTDALAARERIVSALARVRSGLPAGAEPELENIGTSLAMVSTYSVSGADAAALRSWVEYTLVPAVTAVAGVERVQVMGGGQAALVADLDPLLLQSHHVGVEEVVEAVGRAVVLGTGGFMEVHGRDVLISSRAQVRGPDDLAGVMVAHDAEGGPVLLGDLARVHKGTLPRRYETTADRHPAVVFNVQKQPGASTLAVSRGTEAALARLPLPRGARLEKFYDQAGIIGLAYRNMRNQLLLGALLAATCLFLVLGGSRTTWIVVVSIPLSVIGSFVLMRWAGFGINLMTLGALTVTIGMIDDDAILVLENVFRHRQMGKAPADAAGDGVREILGADVAGTLTTLAAFMPLALVGGLAGRLFLPFGLTLSFVLLLSLLFSVTLIPIAAARWLPERSVPFDPSAGRIGRWVPRMVALNRRLLSALLRHRALTTLLAVLLMLVCLVLPALNRVRFLPLLDEGSLLVSYQLAPGTSLAESNRFGDHLEAMVLKQPGVEGVFRRTGSPESTSFIEGPDEGELVARLAPSGRGPSAFQVKEALDARLATLPGVLIRVNEPTSEKLDESLSGLPGLFGITIVGDNLSDLHEAASRIEEAALSTPGIASVVNNTKVPVDTLQVEIARDACAELGVPPEEVARAVEIAMQGMVAGRAVVGGRAMPLFVRYAPGARRSAQDLGRVLVPGPDGSGIPLGRLAEIRSARAYRGIEHQFGSRALTLPAAVSGNPYAVMGRLDAAVARLGLPAGVRVNYTGEYAELLRIMGRMVWILLGSAVLVYGIMAIQLGSLLDPAVVLVKIPVDFAGAALALFLTRQELDFTVLIGLVTLVGVSVDNGIVLLSFVRQLRLEGRDAVTAVHEAVEVRFRPLLLTQLTSILALVPAALGLGKGPQLLQSLGIMLAGGLAVGTILTLNLVPVLYVATERWRRAPAGGPRSPGRRAP